MQQALDLAKVHLESAKCRGCSHEQKLLHTIQAIEYQIRAFEQLQTEYHDRLSVLEADFKSLKQYDEVNA